METAEKVSVQGNATQGGERASTNLGSGFSQNGNKQGAGTGTVAKERTPERLLAPQTNPRPPTSAETLRIGLNKLAEDSDSGSDMDTGDSDDSLSSADSDVAATPAKPTTKLSTTSLETVLFPSPTTFKSADDFFDQCREKLEASYGYHTNRYQQEAHYLRAGCTLRNKRGCTFVVRANRIREGGWELDEEKCRWLHSHGPNRLDEKRRKVALPADRDSSSSETESGSESESEEEPLIKQTARIQWKTSTKSQSMRNVLSKRDEIFAKQRLFASSPLQTESRRLVQDEIDGLAIPSTNSKHAYEYEHIRYIDFMSDAKLPPFPISLPIVALYIVYRTSILSGSPTVINSWFNRLRGKLASIWEDDAVYQELEEWKDVETGIREFMREVRETVNPRSLPEQTLPTGPRHRQKQTYPSDVESAHETDEDWSHADTRSDQHSDKETSSSDDESDDETVIGRSSDSERKASTSKVISQQDRGRKGSSMTIQKAKITIPGLPAVNEEVASPVALYKLCVRKHVEILGINVNLMPSTDTTYRVRCSRHHTRYADSPMGSCEFSIAIERVDKKWVVRPWSKWEHNHGPAVERLANPEWMPRILNSDARATLGLAPLPEKVHGQPRKRHKSAKGKDKADQPRKEEEMPKKKKKKRSHEVPIPSFSLSQQSYPSPAASDQQYRSPQPQGQKQPPPPPPRAQETFRRPAIPQPQPRIQPPIAAPPLASSSNLAQAIPIPRSTLETPVECEDEFFTTLNSFLSALHPSLTSLAPAVFASGVRSFEVLTLLSAFESTTLDLYLAELKNQYELSNVHLKIFKKKLIEAKEEGWMN